MSGKYDDASPAMRATLERAEATVAYLGSRLLLSQQEIADLTSYRYLLQQWDIAQLQIRVQSLEDQLADVRARLPGPGA